jgi:hypothetical protein
MDILKILAYNNDRTIRETVVSSIFNYLLDPYGDHGFGSSFLLQFLETLKGACSFIDDALIAKVQSFALSEDFDISISSEWMPKDKQAFQGRRLDSLLEIRSGNSTFLIGTEVKIYEDSSQDPTQLDDYAAMLAIHRESVSEDSNTSRILGEERDVKVALVYLVPGSAEKAFVFARTAVKACRENGIDGIILLPWWKPEASAASKDIVLARTPMDQILNVVIKQYLYGAISPCDPHAMDVVRSLAHAISRQFNFKPERGESRFVVGSDYESGLTPYSRILLEAFRQAAAAEGIKRPLTASPRHTSIGIPFKSSPQKGVNNTLCRIETVESYKTGAPRTSFVLELSRKIYERDITLIEEALTSPALKGQIDDKPGQYHENGKDDEEVIRIKFAEIAAEPSDDERAQMTKQFQTFIAMLKKIFQSNMG